MRFVFVLIAAAAVIGFSVLVMGNYFGKQKQEQALEDERNRMIRRYSAEDQSLPIAHIAVETQELSGDTKVVSTTVLIKQYRFNKRASLPASAKANTIMDEYSMREALPLKRVVVKGKSLVVRGIHTAFQTGIPQYEFVAGKSVGFLSAVVIDPKNVETLYATASVPEVLLDEGRQPSLMESNLCFYVV
jgi:hypothetical protein